MTKKLTFLLFSLFFLSACGTDSTVTYNSDPVEENLEEEVERELLYLTIDRMYYDADTEEMVAEITTNLPVDTEAYSHIKHPLDTSFGDVASVTIQEGKNEIRYGVGNVSRIVDGEYGIYLSIDVDGESEITENEHFLTDKRVGGNYSELEEEYWDIDTLFIMSNADDYDYYTNDDFYIKLYSSNKVQLDSVISEEERQIVEEKKEKEREVTYMDNLTSHAGELQGQFRDFSDLFANPNLNDFNWMVDVSVAITEISRLSKIPEGWVSIPGGYQNTHATYLEAMNLYQTAMDILPTALDNSDVAEINEVASLMEQALVKVTEVQNSLGQ